MIEQLMQSLSAQHAQAASQFDRLQGATEHLSDMAQALGQLTALGQNVTRDDVMEQVMRLVEMGRLSSKEAALALGQMPLQGPALADWVKGHAQQYAALTQQAGQLHEAARQRMGASALHLLAHARVLGQVAAQQPNPLVTPNG